jgi:hypothetical protein
MECIKKIYSIWDATQEEYSMSTSMLNDAILMAKMKWRQDIGTLLMWCVGIVIRKNDGKHSLMKVQDPSFSL